MRDPAELGSKPGVSGRASGAQGAGDESCERCKHGRAWAQPAVDEVGDSGFENLEARGSKLGPRTSPSSSILTALLQADPALNADMYAVGLPEGTERQCTSALASSAAPLPPARR